MIMQNRDTITFYHHASDVVIIAVVTSSMVPQVGQYVSIRQTRYVVKWVTFALDYADSIHETALRCNVELEFVNNFT